MLASMHCMTMSLILSLPSYQQVFKFNQVCLKEASSDPRWVQVMQLEIAGLEDNNTWSIVDLPPAKSQLVADGSTRSNSKPLVKWRNLKSDMLKASARIKGLIIGRHSDQ